jgi:predicted AAA+ superfamily ATPase
MVDGIVQSDEALCANIKELAQKDERLRGLIKDKNVSMKVRGGETVKFTQLCYDIAQHMWDKKAHGKDPKEFDACLAPKATVLKAACKVLDKMVNTVPATGTKSEPTTPASSTVSANAQEPAKTETKGTLVEQAVHNMLSTAVALAEQYDKKPGADKRLEMLKKALPNAGKFSVEQPIMTLLISAENLVENHDKKPGNEKSVETLKKAIKLWQEVIA